MVVLIRSISSLWLGALTIAASLPQTQQQLVLDDYQVHTIPNHPDHSVRIRSQSDDLCDAGSKQYTGWLDAGGKHLFFWYIESLNNPLTDPLNLWMTGGPGCSGLIGMMFELGPCLINDDGTGTYRNTFSWTRNSSMIFIDQPAGTGFSYADKESNMPGDSFVAAQDMDVFLRIFYTIFPSLQYVPFHISSESYSGHYVPTLSAEIMRTNKLVQRLNSSFEIPLKSVMIRDGFISPLDITLGYYETLYTTKNSLPEPVFNETRCTQIANALPRCEYLHEACYAYPDTIIYHAADSFYNNEIRELYNNETGEGGQDPFDVTHTCEVNLLCYSSMLKIQDYMNSPAV